MWPEWRSVCFGHLLLLIRARGSRRKLLLNNNYIRVALKLPADVNGGPAWLIRFSLPQYLMRHRGGVSLTEKYEFQYEACGGESQQRQHEHFPTPAGKQVFQHRDRTLAVRTGFGDTPVHRQRPEECQQNQRQRGYWRKRSGGQIGDPGLIAERGKVIYAVQTHYLPPGVRVTLSPLFVRAFHLFDLSFEEPFFERAEWFSIYSRSCF